MLGAVQNAGLLPSYGAGIHSLPGQESGIPVGMGSGTEPGLKGPNLRTGEPAAPSRWNLWGEAPRSSHAPQGADTEEDPMATHPLTWLVLSLALAAGPALAGEAGTGMDTEGQAVLERHDISETELDQFVETHLAVEEIRKQYFVQIRGGKQMGTDTDRIKDRMHDDMRNVVDKAPISADTYKRIAASARDDQALRNMIFDRMQAKISRAEGQAAMAE